MSTPIPSRYEVFERPAWAALAAATPLTLTKAEVDDLTGLNVRLDVDQVVDIYLPLSRLLNLHVAATQQLHEVTGTFLGALANPVPYVIGIAGSVAVGKSTTARILQALLARWPNHPRVDLVTTDGFLWPNSHLAARGLMERKGFPESYDQTSLISFLARIKAGEEHVEAPVYSHRIYDIVPGEHLSICQPDVLIIEGLNVLQTGAGEAGRSPKVFVSDFFDFSIYVDAQEAHIEKWYVDRFLKFRETVFLDPDSFFRRYADLDHDEASAQARSIWRHINGPNLHENILPTRERADLILTKGIDHTVEEIALRKG